MEFEILNVPVSFPFKPYGCQLSFMNRVIEALEYGKNCLLESPTGTGKTLSLLCSSLAWVNKKLEIAASDSCKCHISNKDSTVEDEIHCVDEDIPFDMCNHETTDQDPKSSVPKIYYCTRTHKQITQIIRELRKTRYRQTKMTILSSRQHSCINPTVNSATNVTEACRNLLMNRPCEFDQPHKKGDLFRAINKLDSQGSWDLEDLVGSLSQVPLCPYFCARKLAKSADIIFCPYNYVLDPINRSAFDLDLKGHVVIVDEAHNIEDASREAASFKISEHQLLTTKDDLESLLRLQVEVGSCTTLITMVDAMLRLMQLTRSRLVRAGETAEQAQVWTGKEISGLLATVGIGPDKIPTMERAFRKLAEASYEAKDRHDRAPGGAEPPRPSISNPNLFEALFVVLRYMFRNNQANLTDYRVVLMESINYERKFSNHHSFDENPETTTTSPWFSKRASKPSYTESRELSLNFWCLNPSVVFSELASEARCLILVSGTLSPLDALEAELGVTFPIRLEAGHVITADRVIVTTLSHGPSGIRLCGTYQHQSTYTYQDELGQLILQACYIVPGGILCFLPSYALLDKLVQRWETTGLISQLRQVKHVMIEPRTSVGLDAWLKEFYSFVDKFDSAVMHRKPLSESNPKVTIDFDNLPGCYDKQLTGAIVFAVCRGKVSEGLDFADSYGRLVIAVGIPYPAFKNPLVQQKREFNDCCRRLLSCPKSPFSTCSQPITSLNGSFNDTNSARSSSTEAKMVRVLNGSEWYDAQAYRALNQALGRCIRHMNDWGAVLLVDARFVEQPSRYMSGISRWIRQRTTRHTHWSSVACSLKEFVDRHKMTAKIEQQTAELSDIFDE